MTTDGHVDGVTSVAATNIATTSRTNAPPTIVLAEKPKKISRVDFKR